MSILRKFQSTDHIVPGLLFLFVSSIYFMTVTGITASSDGSQYAATRAFADYGSFDIAPYFSFVEGQDYAIDQHGVVHSHLPPGTSLIASVVYRIGQLAPEPFVQVSSKHDPDNPRVIYAVLTSVLAGSGTVLLFYSVLRRHFGVSVAPALLAALTLAFGTATWKYGSVLYSHALSALGLFITLSIILRAERRGSFEWPDALLLGFTLGTSVLLRYTNAVLVVVVLLYLALTWGQRLLSALRDPAARRPWLATLVAAALGSGLPLAFFLAYHITLYGGPFQFSHYFVDLEPVPGRATLAGNFSGPGLRGLQSFLFYGDANQGLFLLSPVAILAPLGWKALFQHSRRNLTLILSLFAAYLLLFSTLTVPNPGTDDGRYLVPFLGLWFIPLGLWLDRTYFRVQRDIPRALLSLLLFGLLFLSVRNMAAHIALSWGYDLNLAELEYRSTPPYNLALIGSTLFPNTPNLPLLWLLEAIGLAAGLAFVSARRALPPRLRPALAAAAVAVMAGYALAPAFDALRNPQPPGMIPLDVRLGDELHLLGTQLSRWDADPQPGDPVRVRLYWRLEAPADDEMDVQLALVDESGASWGQIDTPLGLATFRERPLTTWPAGRVIQEEYTIPLEAPPPYALQTDLVLTAADQTVTLFSLCPATLSLAEPPAHPITYDFEGLGRLTGYDVETLPYGRLAVTLHWQVTGETDIVYTTFVHVIAADGTIVAQRDAQPFDGRYPTSEWRPGEALADRQIVRLKRGLQSGTYGLRVGLYNPEDGARLPVADASGQPLHDSAVILGEVALP